MIVQQLLKRQVNQQFQAAMINIMWHYENLFDQQQSGSKNSLSPEVKDLKALISQTMSQLENLQQQQLQEQGEAYLHTYISILKNISKQVLLAKMKYKSIDRQRLISQRKEQLTQDIIKTKGDINLKQKELVRLNMQLQKMDRQNKVGEFENGCLKKAVGKKQVESNQSKQIYLTGCRINSTHEENLNVIKASEQREHQHQQRQLFGKGKKQKSGLSLDRKHETFLQADCTFDVRNRSNSTTQGKQVRKGGFQRQHTSLSYIYQFNKANPNFLK